MNLNKLRNLKYAVGKQVQLLTYFNNIPAGTKGIVETVCNNELNGIVVVFAGGQREGFLRSESGDDTSFLALTEGIDKNVNA